MNSLRGTVVAGDSRCAFEDGERLIRRETPTTTRCQMSEKAMWQHLKDKLGPYLTAERITERLNDGVPDVVYQYKLGGEAGWLELKYLEKVGAWARIPWKSPAQPAWLNRWARGNGIAGVLLRVGDSQWYYWRARPEVAWVSRMQQPVDLLRADWRQTYGRLNIKGLVVALTRRTDAIHRVGSASD